jgi:hypothetical protein
MYQVLIVVMMVAQISVSRAHERSEPASILLLPK